MMLSTAQHILMRTLYLNTIKETGVPKYYVWTKNTDYRTVCAIFKLGLITSSSFRNNLPTNIQLTQRGFDYGYEHFREEDDNTQQRDNCKRNEIYIKGNSEYKKDVRAKLYHPV